jgi:hypothetical protein
MKKSQICINAAEEVYRLDWMPSCWALFLCGASHQLVADYGNIFANANLDGLPWLSALEVRRAGGKPIRVLMLCFAAAMADTGDL